MDNQIEAGKVAENRSLNNEGNQTVDFSDGEPSDANDTKEIKKRVLRNRQEVRYCPVKPTKEWYPLTVGVKLRLRLPGAFSMDIDIPQPEAKWYTEFYDYFKDKYWRMVEKERIKNPKGKWNYDCLICGKRYARRDDLYGHLNKHMGFYIARCQKCASTHYTLKSAEKHQKSCLGRN